MTHDDLDDFTFDWVRLLAISVIPIIVIASEIGFLIVQIRAGDEGFGSDTTEFEDRLTAFWFALREFGPPLALGFMVFAGIRGVPSRLGSWCGYLAAVVIAVGILMGFFVLGLYAVLEPFADTPDKTDPQDFYAGNLTSVATDFGFIAAGYAFLAYRGLSSVSATSGPGVPEDQPDVGGQN